MDLIYKDTNVIPEIFSDKKFNGIDGLRAFSIIIVLFGHINKHYLHNAWIELSIQGGGLGVNFFFVISGFLITTLLLKENAINGQINIKNFYLRRIFRIFPVAYLYVFVIFCLNYFLKLQIPTAYFLITIFYLTNIGAIVGNRNIKGSSILIGHFWSLSTEEQYYILYPLLFKYFRKYLPMLIIISMILINIVILFTIHIYFFYYFQGILIGALFSFLAFKLNLKKRKIQYSAFYQLVLIVLIFLVSYSQAKLSIFLTSSFIVIFIAILLIDNGINIFHKILNNKYIAYLGVLSYSIYIWQQGFTLQSGLSNKFPILTNPLISLPLLFFISYFSYQYYEKFFLKIKARFK